MTIRYVIISHFLRNLTYLRVHFHLVLKFSIDMLEQLSLDT